MANGFQTPITINDAIKKIDANKYLLPAVQRKFVWSSDQIERLFDSVLLDYPINSFMLWAVKDVDTKNNFKFYQFLREVIKELKEDNEFIATNAQFDDFEAVMDGQQRLTSLYIGLKGTYAEKKKYTPKKSNKYTQPKKLCLNLLKLAPEAGDENSKQYDFKFLSDDELSTIPINEKDGWFMVSKILEFTKLVDVNKYLNSKGLSNNDFASETLTNLWNCICQKPLINYYLLDDENGAKKVLDIFIRTNKGGTQLSNAEILRSIVYNTWDTAREKIEKLRNDLGQMRPFRYSFGEDYIIRTCLVLFSDDVRYRLANIGGDTISKIENNWNKIQEAIKAAFVLFTQIGFKEETFRATNAALPIIYFIYKNNLSNEIVKANYCNYNRERIRKWLSISFLKNIFSGQAESVLITIRKVIDAKIASGSKDFPFDEIKAAFASSATKTYTADLAFVTYLLKRQYGSYDAHYTLLLLYPNMDYYNQDFHLDHMHPKSFFENDQNILQNIPNIDVDYARDKDNWNSVLNLQLLNSTLNTSKKDKSLDEWAKINGRTNIDLLVSKGTSLKIEDFRTFIESRRTTLTTMLTNILS